MIEELQMVKPALKLQPVEVTYLCHGSDILEAINALGLTQGEFAKECGYSGSARITHLVGSDVPVRLKGSSPVILTLKKLGVRIQGLIG